LNTVNGAKKVKVFGIGLSKTGTTSLARALEILDFKVKDCMGVTKYTKGDASCVDETSLTTCDAFTDTPIPSFYQELDRLYPNSKFILTTRDMDGWLKSCKKQFTPNLAEKRSDAGNRLFLDLYDTVVFDEDKFRAGYKKFTEGVFQYFMDRPDDLLVIDITRGEGWEKLCPFLDKPLQTIPFPKSNVTQIKWLNIHKVAQNIKQRALESEKKNGNIRFALLGFNKEKKIKQVTKNAGKSINRELTNLTANIPIVTKHNQSIPLEKRKNWHHFWLVDCSESRNLSDNKTIGFVINVALIEDGRPYLGIVYSSFHDLLYYAALDKGAFKVMGNREPQQITTSPLQPPQGTNNHLQESSNIGLQLCQFAEMKSITDPVFEESKEWHTAAGHAVLLSLGLNLIVMSDSQILQYNKAGWQNPVFKILK
jgi:3'-phosphoadenosine 5'-phosphosulfate (PAPS) 3'-phosphatase